MLVMLSVRHAGCRNLWGKDHGTVHQTPMESSGIGRLEPLQNTMSAGQDAMARLETSADTGHKYGEARKDCDPPEQPSEDYQPLGRHVSTSKCHSRKEKKILNMGLTYGHKDAAFYVTFAPYMYIYKGATSTLAICYT